MAASIIWIAVSVVVIGVISAVCLAAYALFRLMNWLVDGE